MTQRICIFGASGETGLELTRQALERGYEVTAFVRSQTAKEKLPRGVTVLVGNLLDRTDVERAIAGNQAVIIAIGPRIASQEIFCAAATQNIIEAMRSSGVRRLICQTGAMIGEYPHLSWFMRSMKGAYQKQQPVLANDRLEQEQRVAASGLDWTLVKPPRLTNGPARGRVRSGERLNIGAMSSISRLDLSRFILDQVGSQEYIGKSVAVRY